jgi:hypothetical protein
LQIAQRGFVGQQIGKPSAKESGTASWRFTRRVSWAQPAQLNIAVEKAAEPLVNRGGDQRGKMVAPDFGRLLLREKSLKRTTALLPSGAVR